MSPIFLKDVRNDTANALAEITGPAPDILCQSERQGVEIIGGRMRADELAEIIGGRMRADELADFGCIVSAIIVESGEQVLLARNPYGAWVVTVPKDVIDELHDDSMRFVRKQNTVRPLLSSNVPFYRRFLKQKF